MRSFESRLCFPRTGMTVASTNFKLQGTPFSSGQSLNFTLDSVHQLVHKAFFFYVYFERLHMHAHTHKQGAWGETERERQRDRERQRESQAGSVLSARSLMWALIPLTMRSWPELKSRVGHLTNYSLTIVSWSSSHWLIQASQLVTIFLLQEVLHTIPCQCPWWINLTNNTLVLQTVYLSILTVSCSIPL